MGFPRSATAAQFQPLLLEVWPDVGKLTNDMGSLLPSILSEGLPTRMLHPITPSEVWDTVEAAETSLPEDIWSLGVAGRRILRQKNSCSKRTFMAATCSKFQVARPLPVLVGILCSDLLAPRHRRFPGQRFALMFVGHIIS